MKKYNSPAVLEHQTVNFETGISADNVDTCTCNGCHLLAKLKKKFPHLGAHLSHCFDAAWGCKVLPGTPLNLTTAPGGGVSLFSEEPMTEEEAKAIIAQYEGTHSK